MKDKICLLCGKTFTPNSSRQKYCNSIIIKICPICGKEFESNCSIYNIKHTCSDECFKKYQLQKRNESVKDQIRICKECGKEFHPEHPSQLFCKDQHYRICKICGKKFPIQVGKNSIKEAPVTCSRECTTKYLNRNGNPFRNPEWQKKARESYKKKTGYEYPAQNPVVREKMYATYKDNTGYDHPMHNPSNRHKVAKTIASSGRRSKLEDKVEQFLISYNIEYESPYTITNEIGSHCYDFYLPKYKIILEADGEFYHCYNQDANGKQAIEYYDDLRIALIPNNCIFHVIVENNADKGLDELKSIIFKIDNSAFEYDSYLLNWCKEVGFPYPQYSDERMKSDFNRLCKYQFSDDQYHSNCLLGISSIRHFHKSIFDANKHNKLSPKEAWNDEEILKQIISNRLIYVNNVDPSKVLAGLSITRTAPKVSVFNPVLAKYLIYKYLNDYDEIFDPFSGFSGRMIGAMSLEKKYVGSDIHPDHVRESKEIADFFGWNGVTLSVKDVKNYNVENHECLLTCPPYSNKEVYGYESCFKSCDDWIDICLEKFKCNRYVFVVDKSEKYSSYIKEVITNRSHFNDSMEYVVVLNR